MNGVSLGLIAAAVCGYLVGLRWLREAGGKNMPRGAVWAWFGGLVVLLIALVGPVDALADRSFAVHMAQHILLVLVAPPLLALGMPITLVLQTSSSKFRKRVLRPILHSRVVRFLSNPIVGWVLLVGVSFGVHFSPLFDAALRFTPTHAFEHALWVSIALIYWWPIVGRDPSPHPVPYPARLFSLLLLMPAMSFLALAIYSASEPLYPTYLTRPQPWGLTPMQDQHAAAVLMWLVGNLILVVALLLEAVAWKHDEERRQTAVETREDAQAQLS